MSSAKKIVLCCDDHTRASLPETALLKASGEEGPLTVLGNAQEARRYFSEHREICEAWVVSSDEVEGINLAAALKADRGDALVLLAVCEETGSVLSRTHAASLDGTLSQAQLEKRLAELAAGVEDRSARSSSRKEASSQAEDGRKGFLLTLVSGSGGAGKSTVSVLAAHLAHRRGLRTVLIDADLQFGDLRAMAQADTCVSVEAVAANAHILDELDGDGLVLVAAPQRLERAEAAAVVLEEVVDQLLARFDCVVANTGAAWDEQRLLLIERSMTVLFLVDQRVSSVRACRHALDVCLRCGVATGSILLAVNRCHRHAPFTSIDVSSALQGAHVVELSDGGAEVEELMGAGMASQLLEDGNALCESIDRVLDEVLPTRPERKANWQENVVARFSLPHGSSEKKKHRRGKGKRSRKSSVTVSRSSSSVHTTGETL